MGRSGNDERGSALMLVPAGMLVLMVLGAISVDSAIAFSAQRELGNQAAAAANDAATLALTDAQLQNGPEARIDPALAEQVVRTHLAAVNYSGLTVSPDGIAVTVDQGAGTVTVVAEGNAPLIFAQALPGARHSAHVRAASTAMLQARGAN